MVQYIRAPSISRAIKETPSLQGLGAPTDVNLSETQFLEQQFIKTADTSTQTLMFSHQDRALSVNTGYVSAKERLSLMGQEPKYQSDPELFRTEATSLVRDEVSKTPIQLRSKVNSSLDKHVSNIYLSLAKQKTISESALKKQVAMKSLDETVQDIASGAPANLTKEDIESSRDKIAIAVRNSGVGFTPKEQGQIINNSVDEVEANSLVNKYIPVSKRGDKNAIIRCGASYDLMNSPEYRNASQSVKDKVQQAYAKRMQLFDVKVANNKIANQMCAMDIKYEFDKEMQRNQGDPAALKATVAKYEDMVAKKRLPGEIRSVLNSVSKSYGVQKGNTTADLYNYAASLMSGRLNADDLQAKVASLQLTPDELYKVQGIAIFLDRDSKYKPYYDIFNSYVPNSLNAKNWSNYSREANIYMNFMSEMSQKYGDLSALPPAMQDSLTKELKNRLDFNANKTTETTKSHEKTIMEAFNFFPQNKDNKKE